MKLAAGQWVRHSAKEWGPGRVEAVSEYLTVRFPEYRNGLALRFQPQSHPLILDADQAHETEAKRLAATPATPPRRTAAKPGVGKAPAKPAKEIPTVDALLERFLTVFPEGFRGAQFQSDERDYKLLAAKTCQDALDLDGLERLIASSDRTALAAQLKLGASKILNLLSHPVPTAQFAALMSREDNSIEVATAFVQLMKDPNAGPGDFFTALEPPTAPRLTWPFATLLPALFAPDRHIFVQPEAFRRAAGAVGHSGPAKAHPDAAGYATVQEIGRRWLEKLAPHGAVDYIDVQSFIHRTKPDRVKAVEPVAAAPAED